MDFRPRSTNSSLMSRMITWAPLWAANWAMPLPMVPAPTTPMVLISLMVPPPEFFRLYPKAQTKGGPGLVTPEPVRPTSVLLYSYIIAI